MAYGKDDELAINTIRLLAVSEAPLCPQSRGIGPLTPDSFTSTPAKHILMSLC